MLQGNGSDVEDGDVYKLGLSIMEGELVDVGKEDRERSVLSGDSIFRSRREPDSIDGCVTGMLLGYVAGEWSSGASTAAVTEAPRSFPTRSIVR